SQSRHSSRGTALEPRRGVHQPKNRSSDMAPETIAAQSDPFSLPPLHADMLVRAEELAARFAERDREVRLYGLEHDGLHPELWQGLCSNGWAGLLVPAAHGGTAGGLLAHVVVLEALAASNLGLWMPVLTAAIAHAIAQVGPDTAR